MPWRTRDRRGGDGLHRVLLAAGLVLLLRFPAGWLTNLLNEEAYYWMFAKHPALSYYDHPPMVAWTIRAGTLAAGDTELGVRLAGLLLGAGSLGLVYVLGREWFGRRVGAWSAALFALLPGFHFAGVMATPDGPLLFFWLAVLVAVTLAVRRGRGAWWYAAGLALGGALLSKYTGFVLVASTLAFLAADGSRRAWLRRKEPYLALVLAGAAFAPVVAWNARNGWVSFRFQTLGRMAQAPTSFAAVLEFVGWQLLAVTPGVLAALVWAAVLGFGRRRRRARWQFALCYSLPMLGVVAAYGMRTELKANWLLPGYLGLLPATTAGVLALVRRARMKGRRSAWRRAAAWSIGAAWMVDVLVLLHLAVRLPGLPPVSQVHAWKELGRRVEKAEDEMEGRLKRSPFIIGDGKSAIASELAFYMRDPGEEEWRHVTSQFVLGQAGRNYIYWSRPEDYVGRDALYVTDDDDLREVPLLRKAFASVESARTLMQVAWRGMTLRRFWVVECHGYLGVPGGEVGRRPASPPAPGGGDHRQGGTMPGALPTTGAIAFDPPREPRL